MMMNRSQEKLQIRTRSSGSNQGQTQIRQVHSDEAGQVRLQPGPAVPEANASTTQVNEILNTQG